MVKNLVIVESPAKAKTIEGYLGQDFVVRSSYGHVRDLPKDNNAIDIANGFKPTYVVSADKRELIAQLKKLAKEAETVWLASDDDREGEAISWHLAETLNLPAAKTRRIVFRALLDDFVRLCAEVYSLPVEAGARQLGQGKQSVSEFAHALHTAPDPIEVMLGTLAGSE